MSRPPVDRTTLEIVLAIESMAADHAEECRNAQTRLAAVKHNLIGRHLMVRRLCDRLTGEYQITDLEIGDDGRLMAAGLKVKSNGALGDKAWRLGEITWLRLAKDLRKKP